MSDGQSDFDDSSFLDENKFDGRSIRAKKAVTPRKKTGNPGISLPARSSKTVKNVIVYSNSSNSSSSRFGTKKNSHLMMDISSSSISKYILSEAPYQ